MYIVINKFYMNIYVFGSCVFTVIFNESKLLDISSLDCKRDGLWIRFPREEIKYLILHFFALVTRQSAAMRSATQNAMPPEHGGKWETEVH